MGLLVNFSQCFVKYSSLSARGKLPTFTFGNKFPTIGCISLNWCIGTISGKFQNCFLDIEIFLAVFFAEECFCWRNLSFCCIFLTENQSSVFIPLTATLPLVIKRFCKCCESLPILFWKWGALTKGLFVLFWTLTEVNFFALFINLCGFFHVISDYTTKQIYTWLF